MRRFFCQILRIKLIGNLPKVCTAGEAGLLREIARFNFCGSLAETLNYVWLHLPVQACNSY
jgi:hypothetical protein